MKKKSDLKIYGIFGFPLRHTLSPIMQEAAFEKKGMRAFYLPCEVSLPEFKKIWRHKNKMVLSGANITVPYKEKVIPYLDRISPQAKAIGAVNTVLRLNRYWIGTNTDADGFTKALRLEGKFSPKGKTAVVLGAGGAARAAVYGLCRQEIQRMIIVNRKVARARKIVRNYQKLFPRVLFQVLSQRSKEVSCHVEEADLIVNATSLGLKHSDPLPLKSEWIPSAKKAGQKLFYDLVYQPEVTTFMKIARRKGHLTMNGLSMLLYQGTTAWEFWTGRKAPVPAMHRALKKGIAFRT